MKVSRIVRNFGFCLGSDLKRQPLRLIVFVMLYSVAALGPALLVRVVQRIGGTAPSVKQTLLIALLIGVITSLGGVATQVGGRLAAYAEASHRRDLLEAVADTPASRIASPQWSRDARAANAAIASHVAAATPLLVSGVAAGVSVIALCASVGGIRPLAGILMFVGLCAVCVVDSFHGAIADRSWPRQAEQAREAAYGEDLLMYSRSGTDLALLGGQSWVARIAAGHRSRQAEILARANLKGMICDGADMVVMTVVLIGVIASLEHGGRASVTVIMVGLLGVVSASSQLGQLSWAFGAMANSLAPIEAFRKLMGDSARRNGLLQEGAEDGDPESVEDELVSLTDVAVTYPEADGPALEDISLRISAGEIVGIAGENGAGKSTLIGVISGARQFSGRAVRFGRVLSNESAYADIRDVSVMSQDFGRYEYSVRDALMLGSTGSTSDAEIWRALEIADVGEVVRGLPDGLDSRLGEQWSGVGLSGGQWQRLALARCVLQGRRLLVLDEPTSSIDAASEDRVIDRVVKHVRERENSLILVSHRATALRHCDRIVVLVGGRIAEEGTFDELVNADGPFAAMFASQLRIGVRGNSPR